MATVDPRKKKVDIIVPSDFRYTKPLRHIHNPESLVLWDSAVAAARRGEYKTRAEGCPHPVAIVEQYVDVETERDRDGRPTNLFQCAVCGSLLRLVDPYGRSASDG